MTTTTSVGFAAETTAAVGGAVVVGAAAVLVTSRSPAVALVLVAAAIPAILCAVDIRRLLLAIAIIDIPLQLGMLLSHKPDAELVGALGGFDISLTTFALVGLYGSWVVGALMGADVPRPRLAAAIPLYVYIAATAVSVLGAADKQLAAFEVVLLLQTLLLFVYVASHIRSREDVVFVVTVLLAGLLMEALIVIASWGGLPLPVRTRLDASVLGTTPRFGGTVGSPNTAGTFFAGLLPLAAVMALAPAPRRVRRLAMVTFPVACFALLLTFSRGAWISAAIGLGVVAAVAVRRDWLPTSWPVLLGAPAALAIPLLPTIFARIVKGDQGSAASRGPLVALARGLIADHPVFGVGANNVGPAMRDAAGPEFSTHWLYTVHNKYLLVLAGAGPAALLAFLWFLARTIRRGAAAARSVDPVLAATAVALTAAVLGEVFHMTVEIFQSRPQVQLLWLIAALLTGMHAMEREDAEVAA
ncbi:MAG: O-antigen polymerase [Acidimicrobiales bacterium]|nr:O-antigen polymerase [Acidimicrobiales bacterium]